MILASKAATYATALVIATVYLSSQLWLGTVLIQQEGGHVNSVPSSIDAAMSVEKPTPPISQQSTPFPPLEVVQKYRLAHGADVLRHELVNDIPNAFHRRNFLVVYYSCPHEAGNLLHDFYNQVFAAIALHRTVLLKYNDRATCAATRRTGKNQTRCVKANTQTECEQSLRKADWLPRYDDFVDHIIAGDGSFSNGSFPLPLRDAKAYTLDDWKIGKMVAMRPSQFYIPRAMGSIWRDEIFPATPGAAETLQALYSEGADLLYGMLFHELLGFQPHIAPPELERYNTLPWTTKTFVLHSRHAKNSDNGDNIQNEIQCLKQMLPKRPRRATNSELDDNSCIIYLMSDRETTIDTLTQHIHQRYPHCTPVVATHGGTASANITNSTTTTIYQEHGKWAGTGFLQDLMLGSRARDGFIGHCHRSSSQLLREMVEYNRHFNGEESPPLKTCCLP